MNYRDEEAIKKLGKRIKQTREGQNISQEQLSFESSIPKIQIGRIERGQVNTTISTISAIARALDVEIKDLFDFDTN